MQTVICQRCFVENNPKNKFCQNCDNPLKADPVKRKGKFLIVLLIFIIILILSSVGMLVYVEINFPEYGLKKRVLIAVDILFDKDWLENYSDLIQLQNQLKQKEKELDALNKKLQKEKEAIESQKSQFTNKEKEMSDQLDKLENTLKKLEKR